MIIFACPGCGKSFQVKEELAGRRSKCGQCGHITLVPFPRLVTPPSAPRPELPPPLPGRAQAQGPKAQEPPRIETTRAFDNASYAFFQPRRRTVTPLLLGLCAGGVLLAALLIVGALWATGFFAKSGADQQVVAEGAAEKPAPAPAADAKPKTAPDRRAPAISGPTTEPPLEPAKPGAPPGAEFRPEAGQWLGVITESHFNPVFVEFQVSEDGKSIDALMLSSNLSPNWLATLFIFPETKRGEGEFKASQDESELTLAFVTSTEARGRAKVLMEIVAKPSLERTKAIVSGEFAARPRRLVGAVLGGGPNPLVGKWHCTTASLQTVSLEFKEDGAGQAVYQTQVTSFTYLFHSPTRRLAIRGASGDCELTADGRLSANLGLSFIDVLKPGLPTTNVNVKGHFTREGSVAKTDPKPDTPPAPATPPKAGPYVGAFAKTDTNLPAFKVGDKTYYLVMTGLKNEDFDADDLKMMADGEGAKKIAAGELVLVKIKTHQGLMEAAKRGRGDLLSDAEALRLIALMNDEKAPLSVRMMVAHRCGAVSFSYPLVLILQLCRLETPTGQFVVTGKERKDKKNRPILVIDSILPAPAGGASKPGQAKP